MKILDENFKQFKCVIRDNLRRKSQTKMLDENFKQFKCVIRDKDNFGTKQFMLGVKILVQN